MPMSLLNATVLCIRPIGVTSDFCPVCRCERRFRLAQAEHRRYTLCINQGRHGHPHHELTCLVCACKVERPADERPIEILPAPKDAGTHEPKMQPVVRARIADCAAMEHRFRQGKLHADDREEMIRHAFYGFARIYDEEPTQRIRPLYKLLILLLAVSVGGLGVWSWRHSGHWWPIVGAGLAIALIAGAHVYWVTTHSPRKRVRTWLAMALAPLEPSAEELRRARAEMQAGRLKAGFRIRSEKVLAKIEKLKKES